MKPRISETILSDEYWDRPIAQFHEEDPSCIYIQEEGFAFQTLARIDELYWDLLSRRRIDVEQLIEGERPYIDNPQAILKVVEDVRTESLIEVDHVIDDQYVFDQKAAAMLDTVFFTGPETGMRWFEASEGHFVFVGRRTFYLQESDNQDLQLVGKNSDMLGIGVWEDDDLVARARTPIGMITAYERPAEVVKSRIVSASVISSRSWRKGLRRRIYDLDPVTRPALTLITS